MDGIFSFCPWCGQDLLDKKQLTRWIHDMVFHRAYFEAQTGFSREDPGIGLLYDVLEYYQGKYNEGLEE